MQKPAMSIVDFILNIRLVTWKNSLVLSLLAGSIALTSFSVILASAEILSEVSMGSTSLAPIPGSGFLTLYRAYLFLMEDTCTN